MHQQIEHYRRKLLKKSDRDVLESPSESVRRDLIKRSPSPLSYDSKKLKKSRRSRSRSHSESRSRSRSGSTSRRSPLGKKGRESITPDEGRSAKRQRSLSRESYSSSPKRYVKERHSPSPVRIVSKYDSPPRRHKKYGLFCTFLSTFSLTIYVLCHPDHHHQPDQHHGAAEVDEIYRQMHRDIIQHWHRHQGIGLRNIGTNINIDRVYFLIINGKLLFRFIRSKTRFCHSSTMMPVIHIFFCRTDFYWDLFKCCCIG